MSTRSQLVRLVWQRSSRFEGRATSHESLNEVGEGISFEEGNQSFGVAET